MTAAAREPCPAPDAPVLVRLTSPGDIVAALPSLCGFVPHESLVAMSLRGPRKRLGLTMRVDLPAGQAEAAVVALFVERLLGDQARNVALVVHSECGRRANLIDALIDALAEHDVDVVEALHVGERRWSSYVCARSCCPIEGTPLDAGRNRQAELLQAEQVLSGRHVLSSRAQLEASVTGPTLLAERVAQQDFDAAAEVWLDERAALGDEVVRAGRLQVARTALADVAAGGAVDLSTACVLAVSWHDVLVRDEVATWTLDDGDALQSMLLQIVRQLAVGDEAPACTLLAWVAYARGEGALANVALDRALAGSPDYSLALLLRTMLDSAVSPQVLREQLQLLVSDVRSREAGRAGWDRDRTLGDRPGSHR